MPHDTPHHPWTVFGPPKLRLNAQEVMAWLGLTNEKQLRRLVREGRFPPGVREGPRTPAYWRGEDVACYLWLRCRGSQVGADEPEPPDD